MSDAHERKSFDYGNRMNAIERMYQAPLEYIVGESLAINRIRETIIQLAPRNDLFLITGESGTGKELVARAIHQLSARRNTQFHLGIGNFVPVNCASLTTELAQSILFGHKKGAFTGASESSIGFIGQANHGTLFLDELSDMSFLVQSLLNRFLDSGETRQLGADDINHADVRIISATNKDLREEVRNGRFRHDLFYRLNGATIHLPPLREHLEDIPLLVIHFLKEYTAHFLRSAVTVHEHVLSELNKYTWPGNVRELRLMVKTMAGWLADDEDTLTLQHFYKASGKEQDTQDTTVDNDPFHTPPMGLNKEGCLITHPVFQGIDLHAFIRKTEMNVINTALNVMKRNITKTAPLLGLKRTTLIAKLRRARKNGKGVDLLSR